MATDQDNKKPLWHTKDIDSITKQLNTDSGRGLSEKDAAHRLDTYGFNELQEKKGRSPFKIFISQFNDFMIWILIAAALISGFIIKDVTDALVILFILIINSVLGFVQEYRAEKALQALKELATPTAIVIRDGKEKNMNSKNIVPGDILKLASGDLIPADCRVIDETNLQSDESAITGESLPVEKTTEKIKKENLTLGDRIVVMKDGFIQQIGTPQEVFDHPKNLFVAGFIGAPQMNFIEEAELIKEGSEYKVVVHGQYIDIPKDKQKLMVEKNMQTGTITLGIRPDHIKVSKASSCFNGRVQIFEMMGSQIHFHIEFEGKDLVVIVPTVDIARAYNIDVHQIEKLCFEFKGDVIHFFDKETGENLIY